MIRVYIDRLPYTAGTYVCNHLFYGLMDYLESTNVTGGFVHVPQVRCYTNKAESRGWTLNKLIKVTEIIAKDSLYTDCGFSNNGAIY